MVELQKIATEQRNPNTMNIDTLSTLDMVKLINREDHRVAEAVALVTDKIAEAVDVIAARLSTGGRLIYCGAGTSGRLGILDAVARGDEEAAIEAMHQHSRFTYGGRFEGTLYQQKNKMIVLNTLLRKAIEPSKVHPYYIDAISSKYSRIIEEANEVPNEMMWQMTRDYCAYVRRYSLKEYSPAVQKVMNYVNLNVAEPLTLKSLAAMCFISPSYLSALFKQETGSTLIDYINTQRVNRAAQLLVQNNHTIAAVAEEVGILDVNYFTKIFKKTLGVTPTRYRREHKEK